MPDNRISYEKLARYIRNESDVEEKAEVELWIGKSSTNAHLFEQLKKEWIFVHDTDQAVYPDKRKLWNSIAMRIDETTNITANYFPKKFLFRYVSIAALIALLIGGGISFFYKTRIDNRFAENAVSRIKTPEGQKMQVVLPDGSHVWLNGGSELAYSENFNRADRQVRLKGEAYFDITKNPSKKFVVETSDLNVVVKGTAFDVSAYADDDFISVSLLRGRVLLQTHQNKALAELTPNDYIVVSKKDLHYTLSKEQASTHKIWTQNEIVFYKSGIKDVVRKLERWYGVEIKLINPDLRQQYTFDVKTESLRELLDLLSRISPIEYSIKGKSVTIRYIN